MPKPFFATREVTLSDPFDAYVIKSRALQRRYAYQLWPMERLKRYIDMLCEFGFNSVMMTDLAEDYECFGYQLTPKAWMAKLHALCRYAKSKGMTRTLFVWGTGPVDQTGSRGKLLDWSFWYPCPCVPGGQAALDRHYRYQALHAPHFDHMISHWGDPGGCRGGHCTIRTAMHLHNQMAAAFRKRNPEIESTFSLWVMHLPEFGGRWPGYESVRTILDAGILPRDVGLAQHGRFRLAEARAIAESGRRAGVWTWYLADNEIDPSIHVHTRRLGEYFNRMPREASRLISWHSMDSNTHLLNVPDLYMGAQLLIDPARDAGELLREFCRRAFGKAADGFAAGLSAIARTRCQSDYLRLARLLSGLPFRGAPDEYEHPDRHLRIVRAARKVVDRMKPDACFKPDFPLILDAAEFLEEIRLHLRAIEQYAVFRLAFRDAWQKGKPTDAAHLPRVDKPGSRMSQFEHKLYRQHLDWQRIQTTWPTTIG